MYAYFSRDLSELEPEPESELEELEDDRDDYEELLLLESDSESFLLLPFDFFLCLNIYHHLPSLPGIFRIRTWSSSSIPLLLQEFGTFLFPTCNVSSTSDQVSRNTYIHHLAVDLCLSGVCLLFIPSRSFLENLHLTYLWQPYQHHLSLWSPNLNWIYNESIISNNANAFDTRVLTENLA